MSSAASPVLIEVEKVYKRFPLPEGKGEFTVLSQIDLQCGLGKSWLCWAVAAAAKAPFCASWRA
jgi:hypothetical protein